MIETIISTIETAGYGGIALLMFVETLFPPIPSELILPFAGFTASQGNLSLILIIVISTLGSLAGTLVLFGIARLLREEHIESFIHKRGKYIGVTHRDIQRAQSWFDRNSSVAIFLCRLIPGIRSLISIPAGMRRMGISRFILLSTLGTLIWNTVLTVGGYFLGENYHILESRIGIIGKVILGIAICVVATLVLYRITVTQHRTKQP